MSMTDPCVTCDHIAGAHIYGEGACRPGFACPDRCEAFVSQPTHGGPLESRLLADLEHATEANMFSRPCQVCRALDAMSEAARPGVEAALAGTIGERTLAEILTRNGYPTGRRAVANHRREAHRRDQ